MADISDITAYYVPIVTSSVYPNGTSQPSVASMDVLVYEGWPNSEQLDLDLVGQMIQTVGQPPVARPAGPRAHVSIYPAEMKGETFQILDDVYVETPPVLGMTISVAGTTLTVSGEPNPGEILTIIADYQHIFSVNTTDANTAAGMLSALATQAEAIYMSGVTVSATQLTVPANIQFVVRQGGQGTLAKVIHRQKQCFMVCLWCPTHVARTALANAIDVDVKTNNIITLPDTSQALITYDRTFISDKEQNRSLYRRDLVYCAEFATLQQFPGYSVTSFTVQITSGPLEFDPTVTSNTVDTIITS